MGINAISHWMDGGVPRLLRLAFSQAPRPGGTQVTAQIPGAPFEAPMGHYLLFVLVDDIPSEGKIVAVASGQIFLPAVLR